MVKIAKKNAVKLMLRIQDFSLFLHSTREKKGPVAEWLGKALQKLLQRFESARDLKKKSPFGDFFRF